MVVTIVHQHGKRPLQQSWSQNPSRSGRCLQSCRALRMRSPPGGPTPQWIVRPPVGAALELGLWAYAESYVVNCSRDVQATDRRQNQPSARPCELHIARSGNGAAGARSNCFDCEMRSRRLSEDCSELQRRTGRRQRSAAMPKAACPEAAPEPAKMLSLGFISRSRHFAAAYLNRFVGNFRWPPYRVAGSGNLKTDIRNSSPVTNRRTTPANCKPARIRGLGDIPFRPGLELHHDRDRVDPLALAKIRLPRSPCAALDCCTARCRTLQTAPPKLSTVKPFPDGVKSETADVEPLVQM